MEKAPVARAKRAVNRWKCREAQTRPCQGLGSGLLSLWTVRRVEKRHRREPISLVFVRYYARSAGLSDAQASGSGFLIEEAHGQCVAFRDFNEPIRLPLDWISVIHFAPVFASLSIDVTHSSSLFSSCTYQQVITFSRSSILIQQKHCWMTNCWMRKVGQCLSMFLNERLKTAKLMLDEECWMRRF
jgi:hypothetical protein